MKYIIEIENEPFGRNDDPFIPHGMDELYRAKGFKSLVFDKNGLDKLTPYTEPDREAIENEVWEFVRKMISTSENEVSEMWGCVTNFGEVMHNTTYQEAKTKYEEWKAEREQIRVGDEVEIAGTIGIVTRVPYLDEERVHYITKSGTVYCINAYADIVKTGRFFPEIAELLKKMREDHEKEDISDYDY